MVVAWLVGAMRANCLKGGNNFVLIMNLNENYANFRFGVYAKLRNSGSKSSIGWAQCRTPVNIGMYEKRENV